MLSDDVRDYLDRQARALNHAAARPTANRSMLVRLIVGGVADAGAQFSGQPDEQALRRAVSSVVGAALALRRSGSTPTHRG